ncbi:hypothetical protein C7M84_018113 [Penaeus vannamei]|uniref:Uncharacterized protein n=1 Tax=Penaeus vannamei TaxID=6689 RepID=A0A423SIK5_PENVA|nr:hypothetical protein C7M84_018113 [Penaeus vannamei]
MTTPTPPPAKSFLAWVPLAGIPPPPLQKKKKKKVGGGQWGIGDPLLHSTPGNHITTPPGAVPPSARQAPAPAGRMEGPVSGRVGCGPAPPTIGRGGWVRGRGWRSGLPGGAGSAGRRSRAPPLACCVAAAGAAARLPLGPFPRAAAWPERAGGAACPARPFSHVFLGWPGDGLGFSLPLRPPAPSRAEGGGPWPGLPASSSLEQGLALASPHQPLAPSGRGRRRGIRAWPCRTLDGALPRPDGQGGPWARSCVAEGLRRQRQGDCLGCGRRGATPASSPLLLLLRPPSGPALRPRAGGAGPAHSPVWRLGLPFPFPLRPPAPSRAGGGGGGGGRGLCRREEAPASPAPVLESGAGFGGSWLPGPSRGALPALLVGGVWCLLGVWAPSCALGKLGRRSLPRISLPPNLAQQRSRARATMPTGGRRGNQSPCHPRQCRLWSCPSHRRPPLS